MTPNENSEHPQIPSAPGIGRYVYSRPGLFRRYGEVISAYDPKTQVGGIYHLAWQEWCVWYPLTADEFAERVARAVAIAEAVGDGQKTIATH
ncbi:MAG: hypothetical protein D6720_13145 [Gammaproteobacteria bacterium]|nr:MAG: hypothetical protein D6720_13145 [Gammaproteobacteria bacterium]